MEVKVDIGVYCSLVSPFGWLFRGSGRITTKYSKSKWIFRVWDLAAVASEAEKCEKSIGNVLEPFRWRFLGVGNGFWVPVGSFYEGIEGY